MVAALAATAASLALTTAPLPAKAASISPDGAYSYTLKQNGSVLGTSTVTVKRAADGVHLRESETWTTLYGPVDAQAEEAVDGTSFAPLTWVATYTTGGGSYSLRLTINGSSAAQSVDGSARMPLTLQPATQGMTVLDQALVSGFMVLPAQVAASKVVALTMLVPSANSALTLRIDRGALPARPASAAAADVGLSVSAPVALTIWYDPSSLVVDEVDVPSEALVIALTKRS
jgi:hypothetical protein